MKTTYTRTGNVLKAVEPAYNTEHDIYPCLEWQAWNNEPPLPMLSPETWPDKDVYVEGEDFEIQWQACNPINDCWMDVKSDLTGYDCRQVAKYIGRPVEEAIICCICKKPILDNTISGEHEGKSYCHRHISDMTDVYNKTYKNAGFVVQGYLSPAEVNKRVQPLVEALEELCPLSTNAFGELTLAEMEDNPYLVRLSASIDNAKQALEKYKKQSHE